MSQTRRKIKEIIHQYRNMLEELGIQVERVILYGSYANGNAGEDSDIDLIIISKDFKKLNIRERIEILGIAAARLMKPIEAKGYTVAEIKKISPLNFLSEALKGGITVLKNGKRFFKNVTPK